MKSCAFYIASKLGMPKSMIDTAVKAAYGEQARNDYVFHDEKPIASSSLPKKKIEKRKEVSQRKDLSTKFHLGDSVILYPDKKIGIVCQPINENGILQVQLPNKKIWINHKRVKLHVPAAELYPEDYDFSIIFDTVENRKLRHQMSKRHVEDKVIVIKE